MQHSRVRRQNSFTSTINYALSNLIVDKRSHVIQSGTATLTVSGAGSAGRSFAFTATVAFNGNGSATLTINGKRFSVNLTLGEATAQSPVL